MIPFAISAIHVDHYCRAPSRSSAPIVVFLHGAGGPHSPNLPYRGERRKLVSVGYCVYFPHYLDATNGSSADPEAHYSLWVQTVETVIAQTHAPWNKIAIVGYSLGASVALAIAARHPEIGAVIEISGSLPDAYVPGVKSLPPLLMIHGREDQTIPVINATQLSELCKVKGPVCNLRVYPQEGHTFSQGAKIRIGNEIEAFLKGHYTGFW